MRADTCSAAPWCMQKIAWAHLSDLPTWSKKNKANKKDIKCYMVTPFVG